MANNSPHTWVMVDAAQERRRSIRGHRTKGQADMLITTTNGTSGNQMKIRYIAAVCQATAIMLLAIACSPGTLEQTPNARS